jgi:hypothetical protein
MRLNIKLILPGLLLPLAMLACNISAAETPNAAATLEAVYTAQAATLQVLRTQVAATPTPSLLPTLAFPTLPPLNTPTVETPGAPRPTLAASFTPVPVNYCDWAAFVKDVTVPDGATFSPGSTFTKTWRLENIGTCTWSKSYALVFSSGDAMKGAAAVNLPSNVDPGERVDISVNLTAPSSEGKYRGNWMLRNAAGVLFGLDGTSKGPFFVEIKVTGSMTAMYDFAANYCDADWRSGAGDLGCPGNINGKKGYAIDVDNPVLEDGSTFHGLGLLTVPQRVTDGYLQGYYPPFAVKDGDRFRSIINCQYLATGCNVVFRLDYKIGQQSVKTLWKYTEAYEGEYYNVDVDLSSLAGEKVVFILTVLANGSADADKPLWVAPRIERMPSQITPTITPTRTITSTPTRRPRPTRTPTSTSTRTRRPTRTPTPTP